MTRRRFSRARRVAKWGAMAATVALTAAWVSSFWCSLVVRHRTPPYETQVVLTEGSICMYAMEDVDAKAVAESVKQRRLGFEWLAVRTRPPIFVKWWVQYETFRRGPQNVTKLTLPIWMPLALIALPGAWMFWSDRRRAKPGQCPKCRYDRAGLDVSAPCPECGQGSHA